MSSLKLPHRLPNEALLKAPGRLILNRAGRCSFASFKITGSGLENAWDGALDLFPDPLRHVGLCQHLETLVIVELCEIRIHPGQNAAFEEAVQRATSTVGSRAKGFQSCKVNRGVESPERYILLVYWDNLEDHTVSFREGPLFAEWRALISPFAAAPPSVEHFEVVS